MRKLLILHFAAAALCIVLAVGVDAVWLRSLWYADEFQWTRSDEVGEVGRHKRRYLAFELGRVRFVTTSYEYDVLQNRPGANQSWIFEHSSGLARNTPSVPGRINSIWPRLGFGYSTQHDEHPRLLHHGLGFLMTRIRFIGFPHWAIAVPLNALACFVVWDYRRRVRRQWRIEHHCCPACGYDLRATPDRCPECGHVP